MLDTVCDVMKFAYDKGWISTRDGNASYKREGDTFMYITPSGVRKYHLNSEMLIKLTLPDLKRVEDEQQKRISGLKPSGELHLHYLLQRCYDDARVVIHLHPTYIIAAMHSGLDLQVLSQEFPEINRYTRVGPSVPVIPPISIELGEVTVNHLGLKENGSIDFDIVGLDRHGVISVAKDAWTAIEHVERLEHICQIMLSSKK
jgi:ribulose-5-phosphate 4-epimerase/fuculose-1-phosphate aldolase